MESRVKALRVTVANANAAETGTIMTGFTITNGKTPEELANEKAKEEANNTGS